MYDGETYAGWQKQPNALGVQEVIEDRLGRMLRNPVEVVGCGRTDAGVHASEYYAHMEVSVHLDDDFLYKLNRFLPADIAVSQILPVHDEAHARFDAISRSYIYHIHFHKNPFRDRYSFYYHRASGFSLKSLNEFSQKLTHYQNFKSFAKLHSDVHHHRCRLSQCEWKATDQGLELHISSDRFLRGMVRLITGACLRFAEGRVSMDDLEQSMETGQQLESSWSVPAHGLFLSQIVYPYF